MSSHKILPSPYSKGNLSKESIKYIQLAFEDAEKRRKENEDWENYDATDTNKQ